MRSAMLGGLISLEFEWLCIFIVSKIIHDALARLTE